MTIDEEIEMLQYRVKELAKLGYLDKVEEYSQVVEWLKELKAYRELIDKTEEALGRFDLDNTATYTKFYWDCWKVKEANE